MALHCNISFVFCPPAADTADKRTDVKGDQQQEKGALLQAILATLQGIDASQQGTQHTAKPQEQHKPETTTAAPTSMTITPLSPPLPPPRPSHPLGQVRPPGKGPRFSNSLLPALVQVLTYVVDLVEEREQVVEVPAGSTHVPSVQVTVVSPPKPGAPAGAAGADPSAIVITGPLAGIASLLSTVANNVTDVQATASVSITDNDNHPGKDEAEVAEAVTEISTQAHAETVTEQVTEATTDGLVNDVEDFTEIVFRDVTEATVDFANIDATAATEVTTDATTDAVTEATTMLPTEHTTDVITEGIIKEAVTAAIGEAVEGVVVDAVKGVVKEAIKEVFRAEGKILTPSETTDISSPEENTVTGIPVAAVVSSLQAAAILDEEDEYMQEDMPVVQNDVPVVNEETVPMTMMMSMVMDDAGPLHMSFDMSPVEEDDDDAVAAAPSRRRRAADIFPDEFKTYVVMPTDGRLDDDAVEMTTALPEDDGIEDEARFALPQYRGEAAAVGKKDPSSGASKTLLTLVKLRFALSAEAKRQNFKNVQVGGKPGRR